MGEFRDAVESPSVPDDEKDVELAGVDAFHVVALYIHRGRDNVAHSSSAPVPYPNGDFDEEIPQDPIHQSFFRAR